MRKINSAVAVISDIFGFIAFVINVFLVPPWLALLFGLFTTGIFIAGISIVLAINDRKYKNVDGEVTGEVLLKETANYYEGKRIQNGLLFLTPTRLLFISREKRREFQWDMPIEKIDDTAYGKNVASFVVITSDRKMTGFVVKNPETFIEKIDCLKNGKKGIYINGKTLNCIYTCNNEITMFASGESVTLTRIDLGLLNLPTGKIVANDPCVFFETDEFT